MAQIPAVGDGPVVFFTKDGSRAEVPLSDVYFENEAVHTKRTDLAEGFDKWIEFLANRKRIIAGPAPASVKAVLLTAAVQGSIGNKIQVTVTPKTATTVDITVTEIDRYEGLTLATIGARLGVG